MADRRVRRRVVVTGAVQGVGFRASCVRRARDAALGGWVRNMPDGTVEAEFEGTPAAVDALVAWCRVGPPLARVDRVDVEDGEPVGATNFTVR